LRRPEMLNAKELRHYIKADLRKVQLLYSLLESKLLKEAGTPEEYDMLQYLSSVLKQRKEFAERKLVE
jgi:hypothetical protein